MNESLQKFLDNMDRLQWFRMLVCFMPGLVMMKLASYLANVPGVNVAATALLIAGGAAYALWPRLRGLHQTDDTEAAEPLAEPAVAALPLQSGLGHARMVADLFGLCGEPLPEAMKLVETEIVVDPTLSFGDAIARALQRRRYLNQN